ncbi:MAG: RNA methyltransferase [Clostridiales bacterium]|nr:RNA methyltransferase [Clostridiales bacterium]
MEKITSKSNNLIKEVKKLFTSNKARFENRKFVLEGARLCFDALNSDYKIDYFFSTEKAFAKYIDKCGKLASCAGQSFCITDEIAQKLCSTNQTQGIFAVCSMRESSFNPENGKKYIALDTIQDPSNLGALVRTGEALGINGFILYSCCDLYNPKALRASMGSILRMRFNISENLREDVVKYKANGFSVYACVPDSSAKKSILLRLTVQISVL